MSFPKFLPVVIEIVIDVDGKRTFICRNSNGVVMKVMNDLDEILPFVNELCTTLVLPPSSVEK